MLTETYHPGNSFLHRADARGKVICAFFLSFAIAAVHRLPVAGMAFMVSWIFVVAARLRLDKVLKRLGLVNAFIVFLWLFLPFSAPGKVIFSIWKLNATVAGIKLALLISLKSNAILLIIISLAATTPIPLFGFALTRLRLPDKLVLLILISYRYIHVILEEYHRLLQAAKIRGFVAKNNLHTYRTYAYLVAMVLVRSYERGLRVYQAMLLRGFRGKFYALHSFQFQRRDLFLIISVALVIIFLMGMDHLAQISIFL